jgi:integrase
VRGTETTLYALYAHLQPLCTHTGRPQAQREAQSRVSSNRSRWPAPYSLRHKHKRIAPENRRGHLVSRHLGHSSIAITVTATGALGARETLTAEPLLTMEALKR